MAEAIGLIASVIGIAGTGVKLSKTLRETISDIRSAANHVHDLATSITHFSHVLRQIGHCLSDKNSPRSDGALLTVKGVVQHCREIFDVLDGMVAEFRKSRKGVASRNQPGRELSTRQKIEWVFKKINGPLPNEEA